MLWTAVLERALVSQEQSGGSESPPVTWCSLGHCWFLCCELSLPAHVGLFISQHSRVLLLIHSLSSLYLCFGYMHKYMHVQDLAPGLVEVHNVHTGPLFKAAKVSLDSSFLSSVATTAPSSENLQNCWDQCPCHQQRCPNPDTWGITCSEPRL